MAIKKSKKGNQQMTLQSPLAILITGIVMWVIAYTLLILAIDSGSNIQWLGFFIAFIGGAVRVSQAISRYIKSI